ncbi:MAG: hypothetical protein ABMA25_03495 [Ilumatobacteraceae bacterium]
MTEPTDGYASDDDEPTCTCWFVDGPFGNCSSYDVRCPKCHGTGIPVTTPEQ